MILSATAAYLFLAALTVVVAAVTTFGLVRYGVLPKRLWFFGLIPGLLLAATMKALMMYEVLVITPELQRTHLVIFGSTVYTAPDGQKVTIKTRENESHYLINTSNIPLAIELVEYSKTGQPRFVLPVRLPPDILPAHRSICIAEFPELFPEDEAPYNITSHGDYESIRWLRRATQDEIVNHTEEEKLVPLAY